MNVREVKFKDFTDIGKLQSRYNLKSVQKYKNKIILNFLYFSKKNPMGWVIEDRGKIKGFIGNFVKRYNFKNSNYLSSSINSLVVDINYRQYTYLLLRKYFSQKKISFFLNCTPNSSTFKIWKKLGANIIPQLTIQKKLLYILKTENLINSFLIKKKFFIPKFIIKIITKLVNYLLLKKKEVKDDYHLDFLQIKKFDQKIKAFISKNQKKNKLTLHRDKLWFEMNYSKKNNKKSFIFLVYKKKKIIGLIGLIENNNNEIGLKRLELADFIFQNNKISMHKFAIKKFFSNTQFQGYDVIESQGFSEEKFDMLKNIFHINIKVKSLPFLYKTNNKKIISIFKKKNVWDLSLIDGDNLI